MIDIADIFNECIPGFNKTNTISGYIDLSLLNAQPELRSIVMDALAVVVVDILRNNKTQKKVACAIAEYNNSAMTSAIVADRVGLPFISICSNPVSIPRPVYTYQDAEGGGTVLTVPVSSFEAISKKNDSREIILYCDIVAGGKAALDAAALFKLAGYQVTNVVSLINIPDPRQNRLADCGIVVSSLVNGTKRGFSSYGVPLQLGKATGTTGRNNGRRLAAEPKRA